MEREREKEERKEGGVCRESWFSSTPHAVNMHRAPAMKMQQILFYFFFFCADSLTVVSLAQVDGCIMQRSGLRFGEE